MSDKRQTKTVANTIGMEFAEIPAGSFAMGCLNPTPSEHFGGPPVLKSGDWDEKPVRRVTISQPFLMSRTPVTVAQFREFRPEVNPQQRHGFTTGIAWYDAVDFCEWLSETEDKRYRLPTEAEWEYACRAGTETPFWSGDYPKPFDSEVNPWGLAHMHTGVSEWCHDWHGIYPYEDEIDPVGPDGGHARVVRGGGYGRLTIQDVDPQGLYYARAANRSSAAPAFSSLSWDSGGDNQIKHDIGFRVVQAELPSTRPRRYRPPFVCRGVKQTTGDTASIGPPPDKPHFRKRDITPIPNDNSDREEIDAVGLHPALQGHLHSPGLAVCPNGDLLVTYFSSASSIAEYWPNLVFVLLRLRYGTEEWDWPDYFYGFEDIVEESPMLFADEGSLRFITGGASLDGVPFKWTTSEDNGATWSETRFPRFEGEIGPHTPQPINSPLRGPDGTLYIPSDGEKGTSVLWASKDNGETWYDTGGRTHGRHTTFAHLKDGRILGMGGKSTSIDGFMPRSISSDGGLTWVKSKLPFSALAVNQRPTLVRLQSGRLFFASDFHPNRGESPVDQRGSYVALSEDEGETWHVKPLEAAEPHESHVHKKGHWHSPPVHSDATLGYAVAAQAPNGVIHLITSMNHPNLHFEMNENWILDVGNQEQSLPTRLIGRTNEYAENFANGNPSVTWASGQDDQGRVLLHGPEKWFYENSQIQFECLYEFGLKTDIERHWSPDGRIEQTKEHRGDETMIWTQYWPDGVKKSESTWLKNRAHGTATQWNRGGDIVSQVIFENGSTVSP